MLVRVTGRDRDRQPYFTTIPAGTRAAESERILSAWASLPVFNRDGVGADPVIVRGVRHLWPGEQ